MGLLPGWLAVYQRQETFDGVLYINNKIASPCFLDSIKNRTDRQEEEHQFYLFVCLALTILITMNGH